MKTFTPSEIKELAERLVSGDRFALSRCITMAESTNSEHQDLTQNILQNLSAPKSASLRIAVSGAPGVGKSTFIEQFGLFLIERNHKIAVLAIDPSSTVSKGSILGDKTRMQELGRHPNAFIRPSPAGTTLGGVAERTKESILLCEAAGFDIILIETVGVGQSEYYASNLSDIFLLLILPGAGDALQGIKRGIVEMADIVAVHKADGDRKELAMQTYRQYKQALHLFAPKENGWSAPVVLASSMDRTGIDEIWATINSFQEKVGEENIALNRIQQNETWLKEKISNWVLEKYLNTSTFSKSFDQVIDQIRNRTLTLYEGLEKLKLLIKDSN